MTFKFSKREKNQNTKWKTKRYVFSGFGNGISRAAKNENRSLEDLPQADFGRLPGWFLLSIRTNSITENFVYWKLGPLFVFVAIQRMFSFRVSQHTLRFVVGDYRSFYFHSLIELIFLVIRRLLCLYDKQNNTWFACKYEISLVVFNSKGNSICRRAHVLFSI